MLGEKIKQAIQNSQYGSVAKFAEIIGLTKQGLYYKIKTNSFSQKDIDVISNALNVDFSTVETQVKNSHKSNEKRNIIFSLKEEVLNLRKEVKEWQDKYNDLLALLAKPEIERLSGKKQPVSKILPLLFRESY